MAREEDRQVKRRFRQPGLHRSKAADPQAVEDYVSLIAALTEEKGEARAPDIARRLGVANATVMKILTRLTGMGLLSGEPDRIALSGEGWKLADDRRRKHRIVEGFLLALGVSGETARVDSEAIEPRISEETLKAMARFLARKMG